MSLLILIYTLLGSLAPLAGVPQGGGVVAPEPEPQELVLEVQSPEPLDAAAQGRMEQSLRQRFRLVGMSQVELRREGDSTYIVELPGSMAQQLAELPTMRSELEQLLNLHISMQLLRVHPHSDRILRHRQVRDAIDAYEKAMAAYETGHASTGIVPELPLLPEHLNLSDYMLAEQPVISAHDASGHYEYLVLQCPGAAAAEELLVDESQVACVEVLPGSVSIEFTESGAERLYALTDSMKIGRDRLALVLDGSVVSAPVVHAPLRKSVSLTGLSENERELLAAGFAIPLPAPVRIVELRSRR